MVLALLDVFFLGSWEFSPSPSQRHTYTPFKSLFSSVLGHRQEASHNQPYILPPMASPVDHGPLQIVWVLIFAALTTGARGIDIFLEWNVALDWNIRPINVEQPVWIISTTVLFVVVVIIITIMASSYQSIVCLALSFQSRVCLDVLLLMSKTIHCRNI